jgi:hypothetical protein
VIARARAAGDVEFADERAAPGSTRSTGGSDDDLTRGDPVHANRRMLLEYTVGDQLPDVALPWREGTVERVDCHRSCCSAAVSPAGPGQSASGCAQCSPAKGSPANSPGGAMAAPIGPASLIMM